MYMANTGLFSQSVIEIHCSPFVLSFPGHCSPNLVFILLSDVFDCITLEECDPLFSFVEERVSTWTMVSHLSGPSDNSNHVLSVY